jgi:hypothetical protein
MKISLIAFLLAAAAAVAPAAEDVGLSGKWEIQRSAAGTESRQDCVITQKESALTGTCRDERGTVQMSGKVDGKHVTWSYKGESPGGPLTVVYNGTIVSPENDSPEKITGKVLAVEFSIEGEFTATRAK